MPKNMRSSTDLLVKFIGGEDISQLGKGLKVSIPADKALVMFEEDLVRCEIGRLLITIQWIREKEKIIKAELTLKLLP